ncbi:hypothetical protein MTO96_041486 [Rhipicephalus appendiculatus]
MVYRPMHSRFPGIITGVPNLNRFFRTMVQLRQQLPRRQPPPADPASVAGASTAQSTGPAVSRRSGLRSRIRKLGSRLGLWRRRRDAKDLTSETHAESREKVHPSSVEKESSPGVSGQAHSDVETAGPEFSGGPPHSAVADPRDLPGPSGLQKMPAAEHSSEDGSSGSDSDDEAALCEPPRSGSPQGAEMYTYEFLYPSDYEEKPVRKYYSDDSIGSGLDYDAPRKKEWCSISLPGSLQRFQLMDTSDTDDQSSEPSGRTSGQLESSAPESSRKKSTESLAVIPRVPLALAPNPNKPISSIPAMQEESRKLSDMITGEVEAFFSRILPLEKKQLCPARKNFARRMRNVAPEYYPKSDTAADILADLEKRLQKNDPSWPIHIVKNPTCNHDEKSACWLLGYQEEVCSLLEVIGYEIVENERQCFTLHYHDGPLYEQQSSRFYDTDYLEAATFFCWLMWRHRCIDSVLMGGPDSREPLMDVSLLEMMTFSGKLVVARIGAGSKRPRGLFTGPVNTRRIPLRTLFEGISTLRELCFFMLRLKRDNYDAKDIPEIIGNNRSLQTLHFIRCIFSVPLLENVVSMIVESSSLEDVVLDLLTDIDRPTYDRALSRLRAAKPNLQRLHLSLDKHLIDFWNGIASNGHLTHLELNTANDPSTLHGLSEILKRNTTVQHLSLSIDFVIPEDNEKSGFERLTSAIGDSNLKVLRLPRSRFTLDTIKLLGNALSTNIVMRELDLSEVYLKGDLALALVECVLNKNTTLWELKLGKLPTRGPEVLDYIVKNTPIVSDNLASHVGPDASNRGHVWISKVYYPREAQLLLQLMWKRVVFRRMEIDFTDPFDWDEETHDFLLTFLAEYKTDGIETFSLRTSKRIQDSTTMGLAKLIMLSNSLTTVSVHISCESSEETWNALLEVLADNINVSAVAMSYFFPTPRVCEYLRHMCATNRRLRKLEIGLREDNETFVRELPELLSRCYTLMECRVTVRGREKHVMGLRVRLRRNLKMINVGVAAIKRYGIALHQRGVRLGEIIGGPTCAWAVEAAARHPHIGLMVAREAECSLPEANLMVGKAWLSVRSDILQRAAVYGGVEQPTRSRSTVSVGMAELDLTTLQLISSNLCSFDVRGPKPSRPLPSVSSDPLWIFRADIQRCGLMHKELRSRCCYIKELLGQTAALAGYWSAGAIEGRDTDDAADEYAAVSNSGNGDAAAPNAGNGDAAVPDNQDGDAAVPDNRDGDAAVPDNRDGDAAVPDNRDGDAAVPDNRDGDAAVPDNRDGDAAVPDNRDGDAAVPDNRDGDAAVPDNRDGDAAVPDNRDGDAAVPDNRDGDAAVPDNRDGDAAVPDNRDGDAAVPDNRDGDAAVPR